MALDKLPKELLLMVASHLRFPDLESLALILNKAVTATILPLLQPHFAKRRHEKKMVSRFNYLQSRYRVDVTQKVLNDHRKLLHIPDTAELLEPEETDPMRTLDHIDFKEDLHWLAPLDEKSAKAASQWQDYVVLNDEALKKLQATAEKVNVKLPPSLIKFFTNLDLMRRVPTSDGFELGNDLLRVPASVDGGAGGYIIRFLTENQACQYWSLYIEPGDEGAHCVLESPGGSNGDPSLPWEDLSDEDMPYTKATEEEKDRAKQDGVAMTVTDGDFVVDGLSFEHWLAVVYFEGWLAFAMDGVDDCEALEPLREFVRRVYVK